MIETSANPGPQKGPLQLWCLEGGEPGIKASRWRANAAPHGPVAGIFTGRVHVNGAPDETVVITNNWSLVDLDFPVTGRDFGPSQEMYEAWVWLDSPTQLLDRNGNTGEFLQWDMNGCGRTAIPVATAGPTTGAARGFGSIGEFVPGLYYQRGLVSDFSVFGGIALEYSTDGGATDPLFPMARTWSQPPEIVCRTVEVRKDGKLYDVVSGEEIVFDPDRCSWKPIECPALIAPPLDDIEFETLDGCFDVDGDPANYIPGTRQILVTNGVPEIKYFTDYGDDNNQAEYDIVAQGTPFVNCATGAVIDDPEPQPQCADWEIIRAFDVVGTKGVNVERWNANAVTGLPLSAVASDVFTGAVDYSGMPGHPNAPDATGVVESDLTILDNTNDQSQLRYWTYLYTAVPIRLRESFRRAEAVDYFLGECCGPVVKVAVGAYPNTTAVAFDVSLPAGVHYIGGEIFDFSAYSGVSYQYSTDNGLTWRNVPAAWLHTEKPRLTECQMKYCPETNTIVDPVTGITNTTAQTCRPALCSPLESADTPLQCTAQTFYRVSGTIGTVEQSWTTSAPPISGAVGTEYRAVFTGTDAEGYPQHAVPAPDATITGTISSTTNVSGRHDAQSDFWIWLKDAQDLREFNGTAETAGVWLGQSSCSSAMSEVVNAPYVNTQPNPIGVRQPGFYRARLYSADFSANGVSRLQAKNAAGNWVTLPAYTDKPTVETIKGWYCDDGKFYNMDKSEVLDPEEWLCEDPANCAPAPASGGSVTAEIDEQALAEAIVRKQRDVTTVVRTWVNEGEDVILTDEAGNPYPPGTMGRLISVTDFGTGLVRWSLNGTSPVGGDAPEYTTTGPYHSDLNLDGVDLSLVRLNGSSVGSDFSAAHAVYN